MAHKKYIWRPATADDIGGVARFYDLDGDVSADCHTFGILESIEQRDEEDNRDVYLCLSPDFGSNPHNFCEIQEVAES